MPVVVFLGFVTLFGLKSLAAQSVPAQDHASLGISLAREGQLPGAEQELREAVRTAPAVALYRAQLASLLGLKGKWKEALDSFQEAMNLAPENLDFGERPPRCNGNLA